jgi:hypothetical protein
VTPPKGYAGYITVLSGFRYHVTSFMYPQRSNEEKPKRVKKEKHRPKRKWVDPGEEEYTEYEFFEKLKKP